MQNFELPSSSALPATLAAVSLMSTSKLASNKQGIGLELDSETGVVKPASETDMLKLAF